MYKTGLESLGTLYIYIYIYISRLLEKENKKIENINLYKKITIKPKNFKN